jgi:hypothetical protein
MENYPIRSFLSSRDIKLLAGSNESVRAFIRHLKSVIESEFRGWAGQMENAHTADQIERIFVIGHNSPAIRSTVGTRNSRLPTSDFVFLFQMGMTT